MIIESPKCSYVRPSITWLSAGIIETRTIAIATVAFSSNLLHFPHSWMTWVHPPRLWQIGLLRSHASSHSSESSCRFENNRILQEPLKYIEETTSHSLLHICLS